MHADIKPGIYWNKVGIFLVEESKTSGNLYAKQRVEGASGKGKWEYAKGAIHKLQPQTRVSLDLAKAYGMETGTCMMCARTLTNPDSIKAGIGPICASKF